MAEEKNITEVYEEELDELVIRFIHPVTFEDKEYKEIDLTGLRNLTGQDLADSERIWFRSGGRNADQPELNYQAIAYLCAKVTPLPIEFFTQIPILEARLIRNSVRNFLRGLA